jgi:hypothetical protein
MVSEMMTSEREMQRASARHFVQITSRNVQQTFWIKLHRPCATAAHRK